MSPVMEIDAITMKEDSLGQTFIDCDRCMSMNLNQSYFVTLDICTLCKIQYILLDEMHHDGLNSDELSAWNIKSHKG